MQTYINAAGQIRSSGSLGAEKGSLARRAAIIVGASIFVALCAHCIVPLPFTPVPLTLGDLAVLLVGLFLGPAAAFATLALYLVEGASGLPVFAPTGAPGLAHLLGPTGGYLLAYPFAAALAGYLARALKQVSAYVAGFTGALAASTLLMTAGAFWLSIYTHHAVSLTLKLAVVPFLPGQIVKVVSAAGIYSAARTRTRS